MGTTEEKLRELEIEWSHVEGDNYKTVYYLDDQIVWIEKLEES